MTASKAFPAATFPLTDPVCSVLFQGKPAKLAASRKRVDRPIEIFRDKFSSDVEMQHVKDKVSVLANSHPGLQENVDEFGRCYGTGVRSNWNGVRHINGMPMEHATWPLADNRKKRHDAGLSNEWVKPWHKTVFRAFIRCFFKDLQPKAMTLRKGSSSVIPFFTKDPEVRLDYAKRSLREAMPAGKLMLQGNYKDAYLAYQFGGAYYVVYRSQSTDKIEYSNGVYKPKDRYVAPLEYAITGGEQGSLFVSSKTIKDPGFRVLPGFFAERLRTAMGGPFQLNVAMMPIMQSGRTHLYSEYAFSFHHTTRANKEEKVRAWDCAVMVDVSDHDTMYPNKLYTPVILEELAAMGYADWWLAILDLSFKLPIYVGAPAVDEGLTLIGDWRKPDINVGMPSGHSGTDFFGTLGMSFVYFESQVTHTCPELIPQLNTDAGAEAIVTKYLKGQLDFGALSKTDDAAMLWREGSILQRAYKYRAMLQDGVKVSDYMLISYEHGGAFLGDILLYDASFSLKKASFVGNILSYANNSISPEYGVQSSIKDRSKVRRPFPGLAYTSNKDVYGSSPGFGPLQEVLEKSWRFSYKESWEVFRFREYQEDVARLANHMASVAKYKGLDHLSMADKEVLVSPDKLDYKYDADFIDPEVVQLTMYQVPVEEISAYFYSIVGRNPNA